MLVSVGPTSRKPTSWMLISAEPTSAELISAKLILMLDFYSHSVENPRLLVLISAMLILGELCDGKGVRHCLPRGQETPPADRADLTHSVTHVKHGKPVSLLKRKATRKGSR